MTKIQVVTLNKWMKETKNFANKDGTSPGLAWDNLADSSTLLGFSSLVLLGTIQQIPTQSIELL